MGRKSECTSEPGGGSSPVSEQVLGLACRNRGYRFALSSSVMGIYSALQRMMHEDRPGSMGRKGLSGILGELCSRRGENTDRMRGKQRGWWDLASLVFSNIKGPSMVLDK